MLPPWTTVRSGRLQQVFRGNDHRRPLLDKPYSYWDRGLFQEKFQRLHHQGQVYTTMVRPTLEFASTAWDPHKQKDAPSCLKRYSVEQQGMSATISETGHLIPFNRCSTVWSGTALNNTGSTTDSRCCTGSTMGWMILISPASAITHIPGQEEPSDYTRSIPAIMSYLTHSSPTL